MNHFERRDGVLHCEGVDLREIARAVGAPVYVYSTATLERHYRVLAETFRDQKALIAYSVKANGALGVIATLAALGAGADVVSGGELRRALAAGIAPDRIVFAGVAKTEDELAFALQTGIRLFNVESAPEMRRLAAVAARLGKRAPMAFRVNPHVAAGGHANISTGKAEDKFGVAWHEAEALYAEAMAHASLDVCGVDVHIGSQITDLKPLAEAFRKVVGLALRLREAGAPIRMLDLGGGLGIPYRPEDAPATPQAYADMIAQVTKGVDLELIFEPGRMIAGNAGVLLTRVEYVKERDGRTFVILDAGMNDLLRPALYGAHHEIVPVEDQGGTPVPVDLVGPICESTDRFALNRLLPPVAEGDLLAILSAGAYGASMASQYNARPLVPEVLVRGNRYDAIRRRPTFDEMIALERIPDWLTP